VIPQHSPLVHYSDSIPHSKEVDEEDAGDDVFGDLVEFETDSLAVGLDRDDKDDEK
jgi:hypothetical protein